MTLASSACAASTARRASKGLARSFGRGPARWASRVSSAALALCAATSAFAADPAYDATALLTRIQQAAQKHNYSGVFVHQQGSQVQSSRVTHVSDRNGEHEKLELMDGVPREFIRHNDEVRCYLVDSKLVLIEKRARYDSFPALLTSDPVDLDKYYQLSIEGTDRVAGRPAQRVQLKARDDQRYGYRLWFDRESYLLLKAQTIGEKGNTIEQVAFTDLAIGGAIDASRIKPTVTNTDGWRTETNRMVPVDLGKAGWDVTQPVAGFRKVLEVRRAFGGREDVGQMVYSDGLAAISIFIEPVAEASGAEGEASKGPVNVVTKHLGSYWLTVVGDAPATSIRGMARQIDYRKTQ